MHLTALVSPRGGLYLTKRIFRSVFLNFRSISAPVGARWPIKSNMGRTDPVAGSTSRCRPAGTAPHPPAPADADQNAPKSSFST